MPVKPQAVFFFRVVIAVDRLPDFAGVLQSAYGYTDITHGRQLSAIARVVGVVSPSERDPFAKADDYLRAGVDTVWVVVRRPYEIHAFEASGARRIYSGR